MKHVCAALLFGLFVFGGYGMSSALDLGMGKGDMDKATTKLKEMTTEGEDKVKEAKGEAKEKSMAEDIQSQAKEKINEKIDDVQGNLVGK